MPTSRRRTARRNTHPYPHPTDTLFGGFKYAYRGGDRRRSKRDDRDDRKKRGGRKMSRRRR
jgi:hypothetical protein